MTNVLQCDPPLLLYPAELAALLAQPEPLYGPLLLWDATYYMAAEAKDAEALFEVAHVPHAQRINLDALADTTSPYPHTLPTPAQATAYLQAKGLCPQHHVVAYCQKGVFSSPRLWWVLRAMGFARVSVLQGGLPAWQAAGLPVVAGPEEAPHPAGTWQATFKPQHLATLAQVQQAVHQAEALQGSPSAPLLSAPLIVDARSAERFAGLAPEPREGVARGCIPHSLNLPFTQLIDDQGCMKPPEALAVALEQAGLPPLATLRQHGVPVVSTCGSGLTACIVALALAVLGVPTVAVFDGSWLQWATEVVGAAKS